MTFSGLFEMLVLVLLLTATTISGRSTNRSESGENTSSSASIDLPQGFLPNAPPMKPLLYPFVTEGPSEQSSTPGWKPIVNAITSTQHTTFKPLLQDRLSAAPTGPSQFAEEAHFLETIVYGTWKPDHPVQPDRISNSSQSSSDSAENTSSSVETMLREQYGSLLEQLQPKESSNEEKSRKKQANQKHGRRKIPIGKKNIGATIEIVNVNRSDPELLELVKQINESEERTTIPSSTKRKPTENLAIGEPKNWPTDFMTSDEQSPIPLATITSKHQTNSFDIDEDPSAPPQALNGINIQQALFPQLPLNITKMGIPYENQNSAEESSICVPLTVREKSVGNVAEIVDVERVYCFPLPIEVNATAAKVDVLDNYEQVDAACGSVQATLWLSFMCALVIGLSAT